MSLAIEPGVHKPQGTRAAYPRRARGGSGRRFGTYGSPVVGRRRRRRRPVDGRPRWTVRHEAGGLAAWPRARTVRLACAEKLQGAPGQGRP